MNTNEELADSELAELWKWNCAEWDRIDEKYKDVPANGLDGHQPWTDEERELKRVFFEKRDAILRKYGLPIPEAK
ncbi:MAG: hypothetical protein WDA26_08590 [Pusillimonas sp.]